MVGLGSQLLQAWEEEGVAWRRLMRAGAFVVLESKNPILPRPHRLRLVLLVSAYPCPFQMPLWREFVLVAVYDRRESFRPPRTGRHQPPLLAGGSPRACLESTRREVQPSLRLFF